VQLPRKQLTELIALYELEPDLRDVFVEGPFDVAIIKWFLDQKGTKGVMVYDISFIEIPDDEIRSRGRSANNHERVSFLPNTWRTIFALIRNRLHAWWTGIFQNSC